MKGLSQNEAEIWANLKKSDIVLTLAKVGHSALRGRPLKEVEIMSILTTVDNHDLFVWLVTLCGLMHAMKNFEGPKALWVCQWKLVTVSILAKVGNHGLVFEG